MDFQRILGKPKPLYIFLVIVVILNVLAIMYFSNPLTLEETAEKEAAYLDSVNKKGSLGQSGKQVKKQTESFGDKKLFDTGVTVLNSIIIDYCKQEVKRRFTTKYKIAKMEARDVLDQANRRGFELDIFLVGNEDKAKGYIDCIVDTRFGDPRLLRMSRDIEIDSF